MLLLFDFCTADDHRAEKSLALRNQTGEKQAAAETETALARIAIEEGHPADAEGALHKYKDQFHQAEETDDELAPSVVLSEALGTGKTSRSKTGG